MYAVLCLLNHVGKFAMVVKSDNAQDIVAKYRKAGWVVGLYLELFDSYKDAQAVRTTL